MADEYDAKIILNNQLVMDRLRCLGVDGILVRTTGYNDSGDVDSFELVSDGNIQDGHSSQKWDDTTKQNVKEPANGLYAGTVQQWLMHHDNPSHGAALEVDQPFEEALMSFVYNALDTEHPGYGAGEAEVEHTFVIGVPASGCTLSMVLVDEGHDAETDAKAVAGIASFNMNGSFSALRRW